MGNGLKPKGVSCAGGYFCSIFPYLPLLMMTLCVATQTALLGSFLISTHFSARYTGNGTTLPCEQQWAAEEHACKEAAKDTGEAVGIAGTLNAFVGFIVSSFSGALSDKIGRRKVICWITALLILWLRTSIFLAMNPSSDIATFSFLGALSTCAGIENALIGIIFAAIADIIKDPDARAPVYGASLGTVLEEDWHLYPLMKLPIQPTVIGLSIVKLCAPFYAIMFIPAGIVHHPSNCDDDDVENNDKVPQHRSTCDAILSLFTSLKILSRSKLFFRLTWVVSLTGFAMNGLQTTLQPFQSSVLGFGKADVSSVMISVYASALVSLLILLNILTRAFEIAIRSAQVWFAQ